MFTEFESGPVFIKQILLYFQEDLNGTKYDVLLVCASDFLL